jgi:hypothetical protein
MKRAKSFETTNYPEVTKYRKDSAWPVLQVESSIRQFGGFTINALNL